MSNSELIKKIRESRRIEVDCGKVKLFCRRPTELEVYSLREDTSDDQTLRMLAKFTEGWEGATEDEFVKGGDPEKVVEFDRDLLKEWLSDNARHAFVMVAKVLAGYVEYKRQLEDSAKN